MTRHRPAKCLVLSSVLWLVMAMWGSGPAFCDKGTLTGPDIMAQVFRRHKDFHHVFEEQTMILTDDQGHRDTRKMRRFFMVSPDHSMKLLLVIDHPKEVRGVMLRVIQKQGQPICPRIYLPALGRGVSPGFEKGDQGIMGTDFASGEFMEDFRAVTYVRKKDVMLNRTPYFVVEAHPKDSGLRVHFIRKKNFFITRTDFYTLGNRLHKRLTRHDLKQADKQMWQAGMVLMENLHTGHKTLIKTDTRVFSRDYVPEEIFVMDWPQLTQFLWPDQNRRKSGAPGPKEPDHPKAEKE